MKVNRKIATALWLLSDGNVWHGSAFYKVGRKTFSELLDNGLVFEPDCNIFSFQITAKGLDLHQENLKNGIEPFKRPEGFTWYEFNGGYYRIVNASGEVIREGASESINFKEISFSQLRSNLEKY